MARSRWTRTSTGYERWSPHRMEVHQDQFGEWIAWLQGEQVVPIRYRTRSAAMRACEQLALECIQQARRRNAWARAVLEKDEGDDEGGTNG